MVFLIFLLLISVGLRVDGDELYETFQRFIELPSTARVRQDQSGVIRTMYRLFQKKFNRCFTTTNEEIARFAAFTETVTLLQRFNQENGRTITVELNNFADQTAEELKAYRGLRPPARTLPSTNLRPSQSLLRINATEPPSRTFSLITSFDYTTRVVSGTRTPIIAPVRNQGKCGSCYAFAFITVLEAQHAFHFKRFVNLSEQQIVDCSTSDNGCIGGYFTDTFSYLSKNLWRSNGASFYPYKQKKNKCAFKSVNGAGAIFPSLIYQGVPANNSVSMQQALVGFGPLWVSLFVGDSKTSMNNMIQRLFSSYRSGILQPAGCATTVLEANHAVVIVGYGIDPVTNIPFWKARNSWGIAWGEQGYFRIVRGVNMCGIESGAFYMARTG